MSILTPQQVRNFSDRLSSRADLFQEAFIDSVYSNLPQVFDAIVLSDNQPADSDGTKVQVGDSTYVILRIRPIGIHNLIYPDPFLPSCADISNKLINLHPQCVVEMPENTTIPSSGDVIECRLMKESNGQRSVILSTKIKTRVPGQRTVQQQRKAAQAAFLGQAPVTLSQSQALQQDNIMKQFANELPPVANSIGGIGINTITLGNLTESELNFWRGKKEKDSDPELAVLTKYWKSVGITSFSATGDPWSATFISWLLMSANTGFPGEASHFKYTENIIKNKAPKWSAFSLTKGSPIINVGDVLIRSRGRGASAADKEYYNSHGDVVYKIENNVAFLAGGNLGDTAKIASKINLDTSGRASDTKKYIVILKKTK